VQNIKLCELATALGTGHVRPPRLPLKGAELERVQQIIKKGLEQRPKNLDYRKYV